jgi:hypothetical protein
VKPRFDHNHLAFPTLPRHPKPSHLAQPRFPTLTKGSIRFATLAAPLRTSPACPWPCSLCVAVNVAFSQRFWQYLDIGLHQSTGRPSDLSGTIAMLAATAFMHSHGDKGTFKHPRRRTDVPVR